MKYIKQFSVILSISFIAELLEVIIPLPIAASIYGLVLMLLGLMTKIIPLESVEGAADLLVEIMPVLFIPPAVGIMTSFETLKTLLIPLTVIIVLSTILIMAVTGSVTQQIILLEKRKRVVSAQSIRGKEPQETDTSNDETKEEGT